MINIQKISTNDTYFVRNQVLRPGKPISSCHFDGDFSQETKHFGVSIDQNIVGVLSIFQANSILFEHKKQFQLRGMAILPEFQKQNLGQKLIHFALKSFDTNELIWCNARQSAEDFYRKMGFQSFGNYFEIPEIGPHIVMFKTIS